MTAGYLRHAEDHMLLLGRKTGMCRRDIGDYLGLTLETMSRALSQLRAQGVLGFSGARQIVLRNRQRLRNMDA